MFVLKSDVFSEKILEFFKVFGKKTVESIGDEEMVTIKGSKVMIASVIGSQTMRVRFTDMSCFSRTLFELKKQLEKAVNCVNCGACVGSCQLGAIEWKGHVKVNENVCINCLSCVTSKHLKQSCIHSIIRTKEALLRRTA